VVRFESFLFVVVAVAKGIERKANIGGSCGWLVLCITLLPKMYCWALSKSPLLISPHRRFGGAAGQRRKAVAAAHAARAASAGGDADATHAAALSEEELLVVTTRLHQVLRPFMLRRMKEAVASELPQKVGWASLFSDALY
jgi:hypothetical protein